MYIVESNDPITVSNKKIGNNEKVFVIAEAACNHMCNMDFAKLMIDHAAEAGASAIKFQTYKAERLVTEKAEAYWGDEASTQLEYYKKLDKFDEKEYMELFDYAQKKGIIGFSSPFDVESADMLNNLGMELFKLASCEINNLSLLEHIAKFKKPIILSTGASTFEEIGDAVETILNQDNPNIILLACTLNYPTENEHANLNRITTLKELYPGMIIGLSDHTRPDNNMVIPALAVAMGARVIEKHYTLNRDWEGSGHFFSIQPEDLKEMVDNINLAITALGTNQLGVTPQEKRAITGARKSIVAAVPIVIGTVITKEMLTLKRPGIGLPPGKINDIIGSKASITISKDSIIEAFMLED